MQTKKILLPFYSTASMWTTGTRFVILIGAVYILFFKPIAVYQFLLITPFALLLIQKTSSMDKERINSKKRNYIISLSNFIFGNAFIILSMCAALYVVYGLFLGEVY